MADLPLTLDALTALFTNMPDAERAAVAKSVEPLLKRCWLPQHGPQTEAFHSLADETLYGGAAGGGKTDLLLGLATTMHQRSLIFRSQSKDLDGLWERLNELVPNPTTNDSVKRRFKTPDGRLIEGGHLDQPGSERAWMGRPHDFIGFDEAALLAESRVNFVIQWLRSTTASQRKRVMFATNPPIPEIASDGTMTDTATGDWLIRWFAPWIDDTFANPAKVGELRWCYMKAEGDRLTTVWVPGPGCYDPATGEHKPDATEDDIDKGLVSVARSRTFIKSLVKDNVFLKGTGYVEKLSSTPEPLRSMLLLGDFTIKGEDHPFQVIPTQWVLQAQERYHRRRWEEVKRLKQLVLYGDIAQGGVDTTVLAPLYETDYFDELITAPGRDTPTGFEVAQMIMGERLDGSLIVLDGTGGWGGATRDLIWNDHKIAVEMHVVSKADGSWTPDMIYQYLNLRAKMWWEFRLALDPKSEYEICLPPSTRLRAQLCAPHFKVQGKILKVEAKEEVAARIGSSTDEADAVLGAWQYREQALANRANPSWDLIERLNGRAGPEYEQREIEIEDPRKGW